MTQSRATSPPSMRRVAFASFAGNAIEFYDFFIYGTAAALVFGKTFFPALGTAAATVDASGLVTVSPNNLFIEGNNLTTTKARLLLTAAIMKLGPLPHAADPEHPTPAETDAIKKKIAVYQEIFRAH